MKILRTSWGGRGEHGILEVYMNITAGKLMLSFNDDTYSDWGNSSQLSKRVTGSKSYDIGHNYLNKKLLQNYIIDLIINEYKITCYRIMEEDIIY